MSGKKMSLEDFLQDETLGGGSSWAVDDFDITDIVKTTTPTPSNRGFQRYESDYSMASYDGTMVLFNNLPNDADEELIDELFKSRYFKYKNCKIFRDPQRSRSKLAIAWLLSPKDMDRVLKWNSVSIDGVRVNIKYCDKKTYAELEEWNELHPQVDIKQLPSLHAPSLPPAQKPIAKPKANPFGNAKPVNTVVLPIISENTSEITKLIKESTFQPKILKKEKAVKEKSNPFGNAKPVDTLSRQLEIERKLQLGVINSTTISTKKIHDKEREEQRKSGKENEDEKESNVEAKSKVVKQVGDNEGEVTVEDDATKEAKIPVHESNDSGDKKEDCHAISVDTVADNDDETAGHESKKKYEKKKYDKKRVYKKKGYHTNEDHHYKKRDEANGGGEDEMEKSNSKKYNKQRRPSTIETVGSEFSKLEINLADNESKRSANIKETGKGGKEPDSQNAHAEETGKPKFEKRKPFHKNRRPSLAPEEHGAVDNAGTERRKPNYKNRRQSASVPKSEQGTATERPLFEKKKFAKQGARRYSASKGAEPRDASESNSHEAGRDAGGKESGLKLETDISTSSNEPRVEEGKPYHKNKPYKKYHKPKVHKEEP